MASVRSEGSVPQQEDRAQLPEAPSQLDNHETHSTALPSNLRGAQRIHGCDESRKRHRTSREPRRSRSKISLFWRHNVGLIRSKAKSFLTALFSGLGQRQSDHHSFDHAVLVEFPTKCTWNSTELRAMMDTGCPYNLISPNVVRQYNISHHQYPRPLHHLDTMDGHPVFFIGYVELRWVFRHPKGLDASDHFYTSIFYIPQKPQRFQLLVGSDTLSEYGIASLRIPNYKRVRPSGYPILVKLPTPVKDDELLAAEKAQRIKREAEKALEEQARNQQHATSVSNTSGNAAVAGQQNG